ncbi:hypothetical protein Mapa_006419 [Marchantia paleacea]|nr:hypothetical protein Mapa_006419 [Marchantia paleacea]
MAPTKKLQISQEAFDAVVNENVEEFDMEMEEALADAVTTFQLQGVDLSGIITDGGGGASLESHPIIETINEIRSAVASMCGEDLATTASVVEFCNSSQAREAILPSTVESDIVKGLDTLRVACRDEKTNNASLAERHDAFEVVLAAVKALTGSGGSSLASGLAALCSCLTDDRSREKFIHCNGPQIVFEALSVENLSAEVVQQGAEALAASAQKNEDVKDAYVHLKVYEVLVHQLRKHHNDAGAVQGVCDALRSLVIADDDRIAASRTFQNGMLIAKAGAMDTLLDTAHLQSKSAPILASLCSAIKNLAVNDEICKSVADRGGLNLVSQFLTTSMEQNNRVMARSTCILLIQLAGSDANKDAFVMLGGLDQLVRLMTVFSEDPSVIQEALTAIAVLTLRSPSNASQAMKAGVVDITAEMMEKHVNIANLQRQACKLLRNLAVRNLENRPIILEKGLEKLIRLAKTNHEVCNDAASAALRDLGFDDYNV